MKSIGIDDNMHKRLKLLSLASSKKIYILILETIEFLENKYKNELKKLQENI